MVSLITIVCVCVCVLELKIVFWVMSSGGKVKLEINSEFGSVYSWVEFTRLSKTIMLFVFNILAR